MKSTTGNSVGATVVTRLLSIDHGDVEYGYYMRNLFTHLKFRDYHGMVAVVTEKPDKQRSPYQESSEL